ncbi:hypothetical protein [Pseudobacteriovorax antillogorgiicola]|uniref:Uncharacterized protein n=1 Tax=Pseudobacteriovorax antillogorgiicola TaxID=1513793 RepID=A0A1Y6CJR1_9BACT|nr:hypothetical protein [Pseudobacteriovorax antillogorgiicola]TCS45933.1 hypothetical protein EDD56_12696 [Pseudobacteriovorax antillogorgiicola]SMF70997.1 hypothetical protein SAMN06296036_1262 [Pseudobacteriovorax antillogorgiicola]
MALGALVTAVFFGGIAVADMTITIGEMASDGAFINPEIKDRRALLESKYNEAVALDEVLKGKVEELSTLTTKTDLSFKANQQIMANLSSQFSKISEVYVDNLENGTFDAILDGTIPPSEIDQRLFQVTDYLAGAGALSVSGPAAFKAFDYYRRGASYFDDIRLHKGNVKVLKGLNFSDKTIVLANGTTRVYTKAQLKQKIFKGKFGLGKIAAKRPRLYAKFKLMSARFASPVLGAISVVSIVTQKLQSDNTLEYLDSQIYGLDQYIRTINGIEDIEDESVLDEEVNGEEENGIRSIPEAEAHILTMEEYRDWDFEQFLQVVRLFDLAYGEYKEELSNLLDDPAVSGADQAFLGELINELYKPGQRYPDANPRCRLNIPNAEAYTLADMYCVQHKFRDFITQEGLELIAALIVKETETLLEKDANSVRNFCTKSRYKFFPDLDLFCFMVDSAVPLFAIEKVVKDEFEGELCNGRDFFNRDGGSATSLKFTAADCS